MYRETAPLSLPRSRGRLRKSSFYSHFASPSNNTQDAERAGDTNSGSSQGLGARRACVRLSQAGTCRLKTFFYLKYTSRKSPRPRQHDAGRGGHGHICVEQALPVSRQHQGPLPRARSLQDTLQTRHIASLLPGGVV